MRRYLLFFVFIFFSFSGVAQETYVQWEHTVNKINEGIQLQLKGKISKDWHVYQENKADGLEGFRLSLPDSSFIIKEQKFSKSAVIKDVIFEKEMEVFAEEVSIDYFIQIPGEVPAKFKVELVYDVADKENFIPETYRFEIVADADAAAMQHDKNRILIPTIDLDNPVQNCEVSSTASLPDEHSSLMQIFVLGFIGGLVALLTPCVFPMIPLTVSFFTKGAKNRKKGVANAALYGFFIFMIYVLLSLPFHFLDKLNPEILNNISTNVYLNIAFFVIFIFFALSFFGFYEITLPSSLSNKADSKSGVGNVFGIFFMALTLALVSFSCTGPILGTLLAGSLTTDGGAMQLTSGMAGFGLALALPFALFALFPNWLNSLPKSGGWLTTVKIVLGFLELAMALKFFSNADLVMNWGLLKREIFIGIWILISLMLTLYLFGVLKFKHEYLKKPLPKLRLSLGVITALFTLYLIPGVTNTKYANLTLISGFPPPLYYSIYQKDSNCIYGLDCTDDYETGVQRAKATGKAILLDFTGYACVNCRRMEENVWTKPEVLELMHSEFVVISLYVDYKKKLPVSEQFTYTTKDGAVREVKTVGDKWALFETENFRNNAQPLYAILDTNEVLMNHPVGYTPDYKEYLGWLKCGLEAAKK